MARQALEVGDVIRAYGHKFIATRDGAIALTARRALHDLARCRTTAMGGHVERCDHCDHEVVSYNSCRNRHCPKCQATARAEWYEARDRELLPVEYFHVVFTIPQEVAAIALQNKALVYGILFQAAAQSLLRLGADTNRLGAQMGILAVLHTWGQKLDHHPHVHCVVPGGGISLKEERWISCRSRFLFPVRVLSRLFRGLFLNALNNAHQQGELCFLGSLADLRDYRFFRQYLRPVSRKEWVVYSKPPFGGPANVLKYLSRYTHRVAIANSRLVSMNDGSVSFRWKDYSNGGRQRIMTLDAVEFIRRFLLHVLPKGFVRIRHYGLFANRHRKERIELSRRLLGSETPAKPIEEDEHDATPIRLEHPKQCPRCKVGRLMLVDLQPVHSVYVLSPVWNDTS